MYLKQKTKLGQSEGQLTSYVGNSNANYTLNWDEKTKGAVLSNNNNDAVNTLFYNLPDPTLWGGLELCVFVGTIKANSYVALQCDGTNTYIEGTLGNDTTGVVLAANNNYTLLADAVGKKWRITGKSSITA